MKIQSSTGNVNLYEYFSTLPKKEFIKQNEIQQPSSISINDNNGIEINKKIRNTLTNIPIIEKTPSFKFDISNKNIINISPSNIKDLQNIPSGSTIKLSKGVYNTDLNINGKNDITIVADNDVVLKGNLQINGSSKIKLGGFKIEGAKNKDAFDQKGVNVGSNVPELIINGSSDLEIKGLKINHNKKRPNDNSVRAMLEISNTSKNILIEGCSFSSATQKLPFTPENKNMFVNGIKSSGEGVVIKGNNFSRVHTGIVALGNSSIVKENKINWFTQDGINIAGHKSKVLDNKIYDLLAISGEKDHHDGIQAWAYEPNNTKNARFTGKYSLDDIQVSGNIIISTTNPDRNNQGALQGIVAFDGLMRGWEISKNKIYTHSTSHGVTINGAMPYKNKDFSINNNEIKLIDSNKKVKNNENLVPGINLNKARYFEMDNNNNIIQSRPPKNVEGLKYKANVFNNGSSKVIISY